MSPLHLYRASAGSGKTFALTLEYLKLMFRTPGAHRQILAVTFTNRAAGEMKQRILGRLHAIAQGEGAGEEREMEQLKKVSGLEEEGVRQRAGELLNLILNDYSWFSVGTIDKFFQSVIRAFTREIGIQPAYNLELDHASVLVMAIDRLFQELGEHKDLQQWLIRFAEERMEESKSWNFWNDIVELGMQLFKESFQALFLQSDLTVLSRENLDRFQKELDDEEKRVRERIKAIGEKGLEQLKLSGYQVEQFRQKGNSPPSLFRQAAGGEEPNFTDSRLSAMEDREKWLTRESTGEMARLTEEVLMPLLKSLYKEQVILNTTAVLRKNFYTLGILGDIWDRVRSYAGERNIFLIADSSRFLRGIIAGNQVPFIYERTGNRYNHIMLDEFQDTSVFQYDNFRPLLDHALAGGYFNLVVGDIKQSIYRWRNSDWNILAEKLEADFSHQQIFMHQLETNYRSSEMVVRFNNTIFQLAPSLLAGIIGGELHQSAADRSEVDHQVGRFLDAFRDAVQQIPEERCDGGGAVRLELIREGHGSDFTERILERIPEWIGQIRESGIEPGDIAILVRNRKEGSLVANTLLEHARQSAQQEQFRLVSNESLLLIYNNAVNLILSALRFLIQPSDALNNALLKYRYSLLVEMEEQRRRELFDSRITPEEFLGPELTGRLLGTRNLPLYELVESLIRLFALQSRVEDLPYLQALQDLVIDLQRREPVGISGFLQYWDQNGATRGISSAEDANAIRIMTIHKAKGLEFKAVIVPFCHWEITTDHRKSNLLWCETGGTPFNLIPTLPVRFGSQMQHTLFAPAYYQERMKGYMDNLNLMYVAFTRARDLLYLGVPVREEEKMKHIGDLLCQVLPLLPVQEPCLQPLQSYLQGEVITIGELPCYPREATPVDPWQFTAYPVMQQDHRIKVRMRSDEYFVDEEGKFHTSRMYGNIMHMIFSRLDTLSDVERVVEQIHREGLIPSQEQEPMRHSILEMIRRSGAEKWFSSGTSAVYKERSILCGDGTVIRPDRVMIEGDRATVVDFKFGESEREYYLRQVSGYMQRLSDLGYGEVRGYVWYAQLGKTIQVFTT
jgi:ATP-dependent helicase/nuclease subunit A